MTGPDRSRDERPGKTAGSGLRILEVTNIDFALRQFLHPLMRVLRDGGHHVEGACAEGSHLLPVREDGFVVHGLPMARSFNPLAQYRALRALVRLIRETRPDLVHAHMPISGFLARMAAWWCNVPLVAYTCHGFLFNQPGSYRRRLLSFVLEYLAGQVTDRYMTVSQEEARDARRLGISPRAIAVGNGRDPALFHPDRDARAEIRAALGVPDRAVVIVAVSRLVRHKGYPELLRAMESVPGAMLWIVGERLPSDHGDTMAQEFSHAETVLGPRLRCLGYRDDIPRLLAAADIFTLPSHFEGLPMSIIEAMLCGLPVVATDIRGPREQIVPEETGLLVPPGLAAPLAGALNRFVEDPAFRERAGQAGLLRARALYTQDAVLTRVRALLTGES
ncbi:glycosyltransferase [Swaminathania salitolerans LMG 21291]|uniref:Glycosyl transferase n=1 Tax=Swaminathania salitolerans TaxID=182838 RepID=A0A511BLP4_9PROT|nr:glycosyltransferase [Swaminathania salitolerans LMG 21291]GEL01259.1 glycosyl transferase [Swaminathania salitolerans]